MNEFLQEDWQVGVAYQTILSPRGMPPLSVLTVPKAEVSPDLDEPLTSLLADLLGADEEEILTPDDGRRIKAALLGSQELEHWFAGWIHRLDVELAWRFLDSETWAEDWGQVVRRLLAAQLASESLTPRRRLWPWPLRWWPSYPWEAFLAEQLLWTISYAREEELRRQLPEALQSWPKRRSWVLLTQAQLGPYPTEVERAVEAVFSAEIPYALSPQIQKAALVKLLEEARIVVFAPLPAGGFQAAQLIMQGNFVAALETALVAGATTIVLACAYGASARLLDSLLNKTRKGRGGRKRR